MPLRVLRAVKQKPEDRRREPRPSHLATLGELIGGRVPELRERALDLRLERGDQLRRAGLSLLFGSGLGDERRALVARERLAPCVGEEPIERAGGVSSVKADRRRTRGPGPERVVAEWGDDTPHVLDCLEQGVRDRLKERRDVGNWAAKPRLGGGRLGGHTVNLELTWSP